MSSLFADLLKKDLNRKEFLSLVGRIILTLVGVTAVMRAIQGSDMHSHVSKTPGHNTFGSSTYGETASLVKSNKRSVL